MSSIYICQPGESLSDICNNLCSTTSQISSNDDARKRLALIEAMNPRLPGSANIPIGSSRVIVIPDDAQPDIARQSVHARLFASQCSGADAQNLSSIVQIWAAEMP